jgi:predicted  nucleic acid-binding Zn-ribbon protein|uniref:Uncharacterized protein n=1 Tax=candidate division WOR-3 bacterium TaxID=2052148 RepID=A0A7C3UUZ2_UNCW3
MRYLLALTIFLMPLLLLNCQQPQELAKKVEAQEGEIKALKEQIATLNSDLSALKTAFEEHMTKYHPTKTTTIEKPAKPKPPTPPVTPKPPKKKQVGG